jgi:hypothetical protein
VLDSDGWLACYSLLHLEYAALTIIPRGRRAGSGARGGSVVLPRATTDLKRAWAFGVATDS